MSGMFHNACSFNQDISGWNTGGVTDMSTMFKDALAFNHDISFWDTHRVTSMKQMFLGAVSFSHGEKMKRPRRPKGRRRNVNYRDLLTGANLIP